MSYYKHRQEAIASIKHKIDLGIDFDIDLCIMDVVEKYQIGPGPIKQYLMLAKKKGDIDIIGDMCIPLRKKPKKEKTLELTKEEKEILGDISE